MNILSNAIDALEERTHCHQRAATGNRGMLNPAVPPESLICPLPTIQIETRQLNPDWILVRIADNGLGIPERVKQRLFDPFFTTKPVGKGTGLGLSISYQIVVEQHGGRLTCQSSPGQGTEFAIAIPLREPAIAIPPNLAAVG